MSQKPHPQPDPAPRAPGEPATMPPPTPRTSWSIAELNYLAQRAQQGDQAVMRELRQAMGIYPWLAAQLSDLAAIARKRILESTVGQNNLLVEDTLDRQLTTLRAELEASARTPLERLLVERVLTCWAALSLTEIAVNSASISDFQLRRLDHAHARYLASVVALARVSRLLAPTITQVNIATAGAQQLNLAAGAGATSLTGDASGASLIAESSSAESS